MNTILITGANRSIGLALAKEYYKSGWRVIACMRDVNNAKDLREFTKNNDRLRIVKLDVSNPDDIRSLTSELNEESIDILINNAGIGVAPEMKFGDVDQAGFLEIFKINSIAPVLVSQALVDQIAKSRLKIIANMASRLASIELNTDSGYFIYRASKAALNMATKSMAIDLKSRGISVISLRPGLVKGSGLGGPNATTSLEESAEGMHAILNNITLRDSGIFINYDGERFPW